MKNQRAEAHPKRLKWGLILAAVAFVLGGFSIAAPTASANQAPATNDGVCSEGGGWHKIDGLSGTSYTITAPDGWLITDTCVKAANCPPVTQTVSPPAASVTVYSTCPNPEHPEQMREISHVAYKKVRVTPPCEYNPQLPADDPNCVPPSTSTEPPNAHVTIEAECLEVGAIQAAGERSANPGENVQVRLNGGDWVDADEIDTTWQYMWVGLAPGTYTVEVRIVKDGNVLASASDTVPCGTPPPPCEYNPELPADDPNCVPPSTSTEPPSDQCPDGSNPGDANGDGTVNEADCNYVPPSTAGPTTTQPGSTTTQPAPPTTAGPTTTVTDITTPPVPPTTQPAPTPTTLPDGSLPRTGESTSSLLAIAALLAGAGALILLITSFGRRQRQI